MEQLRHLAKVSFEASAARFRPNADQTLRLLQFTLPEVTAATPTETDDNHISETRLLELLGADEPATETPDSASLRLVVVPRAEDDAIAMSHDVFRRLMDRCDMDPMVLQLIANNSYGFHAYDDQQRRRSTSSSSYYVGTYVYSLAWSANPVTLQTSAVLLLRTAPVLQNGDLIRESFPRTLRLFASHLHVPHVVLFVVYVHLCTISQQAIAVNVADLRHVETLTRHGPGRGVGTHNDDEDGDEAAGASAPRAGAVDIDELSAAAQNLAITQVHLANLLRHDPYIKDIKAYLGTPIYRTCFLKAVPSERKERCGAGLDELRAVLCPLDKITCDLEPTVRYLQTRADCQSSVIASLMTHEDARLNTELAAAARRDSSAMRSIAMMTMIFLPATFFAALFSMPCIPDWAQANFWVYWACALPSTLIVLITFRYHRSLKDAKLRRQEAKGRGRGGLRGGLARRRGRGVLPSSAASSADAVMELGGVRAADASAAEKGVPGRVGIHAESVTSARGLTRHVFS